MLAYHCLQSELCNQRNAILPVFFQAENKLDLPKNRSDFKLQMCIWLSGFGFFEELQLI